jgi:hypothetical protein
MNTEEYIKSNSSELLAPVTWFININVFLLQMKCVHLKFLDKILIGENNLGKGNSI